MSGFTKKVTLSLVNNCWKSNLTLIRRKSSFVDLETKLPVFRRKVQICGQLYQQWKEKGWKRYRDVPKEGIGAQIDCFDNKHIVGENAEANVLIFTGVPSSFSAFVPLVAHLTSRGVRVVMPKFPDINLTRETKYFRHSPEERVELIKALLEPMGIESFDLLLSHSTGVFASIQQWKDPEGPNIRSLGFINPLTADVVHPMRPEWLIKGLLKSCQTRFGPHIEKNVHLFLKAIGNGFAATTFDTMLLAGFVIHYSHVRGYKREFELIGEKQVPLLFSFSDNDRIIPIDHYKKMAKAFGVNIDDADVYDKEGNLESTGVNDEWIKMIRFKSGGHLALIKYPEIINEAVEQHLEKMKYAIPDFTGHRHILLEDPVHVKDSV